MCIKCIKWDSRLGWVENWLSLQCLLWSAKAFWLSCCCKDTKVSWQLLKMIKHQLTERSENTNTHREVWSSGGIFTAFSLDRFHDLCMSRSMLLGALRGRGEEVAAHSGSSMSCKDGACSFLPALPAWQQGAGLSSSAFLPACKWRHSCIHMFNETITLLILSSEESFEKWEFVIL